MAGYAENSAAVTGSRLLRKANVRAEIDKGQAKLAKASGITADRVLQEYATIAFSDIRELFDGNGNLRPVHELPEHVARAVASVEVLKQRTRRDGDVTVEEWVTKVKVWDKRAALADVARVLAMFKDRVEHSGGPIQLVVSQADERL